MLDLRLERMVEGEEENSSSKRLCQPGGGRLVRRTNYCLADKFEMVEEEKGGEKK